MPLGCEGLGKRRLQSWWQSIKQSDPYPHTQRRFKNLTTNPRRPSIDIQHIINNPGLYEQNCIDRNYKEYANHSWDIVAHRKARRELLPENNALRQRIKQIEKDIAQLRSQKTAAGHEKDEVQTPKGDQALLYEVTALRDQLEKQSAQEKAHEESVQEKALALPNLSSLHTRTGDEPDVVECTALPQKHLQNNTSHVTIGEKLDLFDFVGAAAVSGSGWYYLKNQAALLEQALIQMALAELYHRKWQIISPPSMVYSNIVSACGFQPRGEHDERPHAYDLVNEDNDSSRQRTLAATAEIPLAGLYTNRTLDHTQLPLKTAAVSRCYRPETGSDPGLYRVHEFTKVEMFAWTLPDTEYEQGKNFDIMPVQQSPSEQVFDEMIDIQKALLDRLGLSYRLLEMPSADLGASATRKRDIEVYFPSRKEKNGGYGEVTSTSICTDYQTRRLSTRLKQHNGTLSWPYTVNGTALAIPRVLAALLETGWNEKDNSVSIPEGLTPWTSALERVG